MTLTFAVSYCQSTLMISYTGSQHLKCRTLNASHQQAHLIDEANALFPLPCRHCELLSTGVARINQSSVSELKSNDIENTLSHLTRNSRESTLTLGIWGCPSDFWGQKFLAVFDNFGSKDIDSVI